MEKLIEGYRRFRKDVWPGRRALFESLAERGQRPRTMVVACVDSRVDPAMVFDAAPGEIFTVRNVANLVPPYAPDGAHHSTSAALEFGVRTLQVRDLIVLGHAMCGGIRALLDGTAAGQTDFVGSWIAIAAPAKARALKCTPAEDAQDVCEHEAVKLSLQNLMTFPWIAGRVKDGGLTLHGARFDIRSGVLEVLRSDGTFAAA